MADEQSSGPSGIVIGVAVIVLVLYAWLTWYMVQNVGVEDPDWSRLTFVFAGAEAVVFSAAGWLFGVETQRRQTDQANTSATEQRTRADGFSADSEVMKALMAAIEAAAATGGDAGGGVPTSSTLSRDRAAGAPPPYGQPKFLDPHNLLAIAEAARRRAR